MAGSSGLALFPTEVKISIFQHLDPASLGCLTRVKAFAAEATEVLYKNDSEAGVPQALVWAARNGRITTLKLSLDFGGMTRVNETQSWTAEGREFEGAAMHFAAQRGHDQIVKVLLQHNAHTEVAGFAPGGIALTAGLPANVMGCTALGLAIAHGRTSTIKLLVEKGAEINAVATTKGVRESNMGIPAFHVASLTGSEDAVDYLRGQPGDQVDQVDDEGRSALHWAAMLPNGQRLIGSLIDAGCWPDAVDIDGMTAYCTGVQCLNPDGLLTLLENGADAEFTSEEVGTEPFTILSERILRLLQSTSPLTVATRSQIVRTMHIVLMRNHDSITEQHARMLYDACVSHNFQELVQTLYYAQVGAVHPRTSVNRLIFRWAAGLIDVVPDRTFSFLMARLAESDPRAHLFIYDNIERLVNLELEQLQHALSSGVFPIDAE